MEATKVIAFPPAPIPEAPLDRWMWSVEEMEDELGPAPDAQPDPAPTVSSYDQAERHLHAVARLRRERDAVEAHAQLLRERIDRLERRLLADLERKEAWHQQGLWAFLVNSGRRSLELVNGKLKLVKGRERVEVADPEQFVANADPELVRRKLILEPDKRAILARIHTTGEIPEGTELVQGDDSFKVETE